MKPIAWSTVVLCLASSLGLTAQNRPESPNRSQGDPGNLPPGQAKKEKLAEKQLVTERGPHSQRVQNLVPFQDPQGDWQYSTNTYVHLEPGLNYQAPNGEWTEAKEEFELGPQGAVARQGQHQVTLPANLNGGQPVTLIQPDGKVVTSRPRGLALFDPTTGKALLLGELKDCQGYLIAPNKICYPDAFSGSVKADICYTYTINGFEQDIVLRENFNSADSQNSTTLEKAGLNPATTVLEIWSEFLTSPKPKFTAKTLNPQDVAQGKAAFTDEELDFGSMKMGAGRAFRAGDRDGTAVPVGKTWLKDPDHTYLIEAVELQAIHAELQLLPKAPEGAGLQRKAARRETVLRQLPPKPRGDSKPDPAAIRPASPELLVALNTPAFVVDYSTVNSGQLPGNYVFQGDTTYYINGAVSTATSTTAATTFEGGAVFKYNTGVGASLAVKTPVIWQGSLYRPLQFTSKHDNSCGEFISGSTNNPATSDFTALNLDGSTAGANTSFNLAHLRIAYAQTAIDVYQQSAHSFRHIQIVNCTKGINATTATIYVGNALFFNMGSCLSGALSTALLEHATVDTATTFSAGDFGTGGPKLRNSIFYQIQSLPIGSYTDWGGLVFAGTNPFQTVKGGRHYLAPGSLYRNAGVNWISATLSADLKQLTTYPPVELTTSFALDQTLLPQALRDQDILDIGYHYSPIDYLWSNLSISSGKTLTLKNGVAIGCYGNAGLNVNGNAAVVGQGLPNALNRFTILNTVQEQLQGIITNTTSFTLFDYAPNVTLRFTDISFLAAAPEGRSLQPSYYNQTLNLSDCQIRGVYSRTISPYYAGYTGSQLILRNNLLERSSFALEQGLLYLNSPHYLTITLQNCLFSRCSLYFARATTAYGDWTITDNVFDGTGIGIDYFSPYNPFNPLGYNAFIASSWDPFGSIPTDKLGLLRDFVNLAPSTLYSGFLRDYYYPLTGGSTSLASLGNADPTSTRTPPLLGLYHHTTRSDLAKEAGTALDIGFHYPATNGNGDPLDTDGDGIADYWEDINGNGTIQLNLGESDYLTPNAPPPAATMNMSVYASYVY